MVSMPNSTPEALEAVALRHGFSVDATATLLDALRRGNGRMAQFSHAEFSGSGQWMRGGMTMVSDMFNHRLKARVDALCTDLSALCAGEAIRPGARGGQEDASPCAAAPSSNTGEWWPSDLSHPAASGSQNGMRYAYFAAARRLVIEVNGVVTIRDTLDHRIGGVSQQQSSAGALRFTSQHGLVDTEQLPVVAPAGAPTSKSRPATEPMLDSVRLIERLAELHANGVLDDTEFKVKKAELLARL